MTHFSKQQLHPEIIAKSSAMIKLLRDARLAAMSQASIFLYGESGVGKEVIASYIHVNSRRSKNAFIKVNVAAIPETLLESEFFGHEKGAFTGATSSRKGRFEMANKGTLLLDEITELPLSLQPKLLRVLQENEFERLGSSSSNKIDVRFIATSNRNIAESIEKGTFRKDLYYRLNVIGIEVPPLRERTEDIIPLAYYFLNQSASVNGGVVKTLTKQAEKMLVSYNYPGNIRELANIIEKASVLTPNSILDAKDLSLKSTPKTTNKSLHLPLSEIEKRYIQEVLAHFSGNKTHAAKLLEISVRTLRNKLKIYNSAA